MKHSHLDVTIVGYKVIAAVNDKQGLHWKRSPSEMLVKDLNPFFFVSDDVELLLNSSNDVGMLTDSNRIVKINLNVCFGLGNVARGLSSHRVEEQRAESRTGHRQLKFTP